MPKIIYIIKTLFIKIPMPFLFSEIEITILKSKWKHKSLLPTKIRQSLAEMLEATQYFHNASTLYCRARVTKQQDSDSKPDRAVDQRNRVEDPETKPHSFSHIIFDKGVKNIHGRGEKAASSTNDAGKIGFPHVGERTRSLSLTLHKVTMKMLALPIYTLKIIKTGYYSLQLN